MIRVHPAAGSLFLLIAGCEMVRDSPVASPSDKEALLAADMRQRDAVAEGDLGAIAANSHPNLRVNAPNNRVLTKEDLIRVVGSGEIRNDVFERTPESVTITGDVGVVMGHEVVMSGPGSEQARLYGEALLNRRYTNVYLRVDGQWLHLARHANIRPKKR